jgi:hypothetical protein
VELVQAPAEVDLKQLENKIEIIEEIFLLRKRHFFGIYHLNLVSLLMLSRIFSSRNLNVQ